jgi:hypothetical protein
VICFGIEAERRDSLRVFAFLFSRAAIRTAERAKFLLNGIYPQQIIRLQIFSGQPFGDATLSGPTGQSPHRPVGRSGFSPVRQPVVPLLSRVRA